jgi:hypothetical protein
MKTLLNLFAVSLLNRRAVSIPAEQLLLQLRLTSRHSARRR